RRDSGVEPTRAGLPAPASPTGRAARHQRWTPATLLRNACFRENLGKACIPARCSVRHRRCLVLGASGRIPSKEAGTMIHKHQLRTALAIAAFSFVAVSPALAQGKGEGNGRGKNRPASVQAERGRPTLQRRIDRDDTRRPRYEDRSRDRYDDRRDRDDRDSRDRYDNRRRRPQATWEDILFGRDEHGRTRVPPGWCRGRGNPHNTPENCGYSNRRYDWD